MDTGTRNTSPVGWARPRRSPRALRWSDPKLRNRALLVALTVLGIAVAYLVIFRLPWWQVSEIDVDGNRFVDEQVIVRASGVRTGVPMQSINVDSVVIRVEAVPWISRAEVSRSLWGRFTIDVVEREPVALLWDDEFVMVDEEGRTRAVGDHTTPDLPLVTGVPADGADDAPSAALRRAAGVLAQVQSLDPLRSTVSEVTVRDSTTVVLLLSPNGTPYGCRPPSGSIALPTGSRRRRALRRRRYWTVRRPCRRRRRSYRALPHGWRRT